jgi:hypothetical protein
MNVIHDIFNRFFMIVCNVSIQLLQTKYCNIISMIIWYIRLRKNDTEQMWYGQSRIHRSQQQKEHSHYNHLLVYYNCWVQHSHLIFSKCTRIPNIHFWMILYGKVVFNYITNRTSLISTFKSQFRNVKQCRDSFGYKSLCAYSVNC